MTKLIDLVGQRFGRLTVDAFCGPAPSRHLTWKCPCDCGNVVIVRGANLRSGATRSCGCLAREMPRQGGADDPSTECREHRSTAGGLRSNSAVSIRAIRTTNGMAPSTSACMPTGSRPSRRFSPTPECVRRGAASIAPTRAETILPTTSGGRPRQSRHAIAGHRVSVRRRRRRHRAKMIHHFEGAAP